MPYERKLPFVANSYMPFGQEAYERGRHYVHLWPIGDRWKFRIYRYGKPKTDLIKVAKTVLTDMKAPLKMLGHVGASETDWALWVQRVVSNKYNYTWTEFYFSEHQIPRTSPWTTKGKIKGPLWADVDPMAVIDMQVYDRAEQQYKNVQEYEKRVVAEDWVSDFINAPGQIDEVRKIFYDAIKNVPLAQQVLCPRCYRYNPIDPSLPPKIECRECGAEIDISRAKKQKKTLTYDSIKDYISKRASLKRKLTLGQAKDEYWIAVLGDGTKLYDSEESLLREIEKEIDKLSIQTIAEEAQRMLTAEMPSINTLKEAAYGKFEEMSQEQEEEEYALVANLDSYRQTVRVIESIDSRGFSKEAEYLKDIVKKKVGDVS